MTEMTGAPSEPGDHWSIGEPDLRAAAVRWRRQNRAASVVIVAAPTAHVRNLGLSPEAENELLRAAWDRAVAALGGDIAGRRLTWRSFVFLVLGEPETVLARGADLLGGLTGGRSGRAVWHVVVGAAEDDVDASVRTAEDALAELARDQPGASALMRAEERSVMVRQPAAGRVDERRQLLADYHAARKAGDTRRVQELGQLYMESVPVVALSRCPHTGEVLTYPIDTIDLDGLWWDYDLPYRPFVEPIPTFYALNGAIKLGAPVAVAPFIAKLGPEVPFVVPRLLERKGVRAVVSSLPVGPHTGYVVAYYAHPPQPAGKRVNDWGAREYRIRRADGSWGYDSAIDWTPEHDYDLAPWIGPDKLAWIAPGDASLTLQTEVDGCPYLGLSGNREIITIYGGKVSVAKPASEAARSIRPNE